MTIKPPIFQIVDGIVQGSEEWHSWRATVIGASDAPTIMGENPWKSAKRLIDEKTGVVSRFKGNAATRRGNELEPIARRMYELKMGISVKPVVVQRVDTPWQAASLDGLSDNHVVEIKCGEKSHAFTLETGKIPPYYYGQLQHILSVTGFQHIDYFSYVPGGTEILIRVMRDQGYIDKLIHAERLFAEEVIKAGGEIKGYKLADNGLLQPVYEGGYVNGKPHGYGVMRWPNGDVYSGYWKEGIRNGIGIYEFKSGSVYTGSFVDGKLTGQGVFHWPNGGGSYAGAFDNGKLSGLGRRVYPDGTVYEGFMQDGKALGIGVKTWPTGAWYSGEWFEDEVMAGLGEYHYENGDSYVGQFGVHGKPHGIGEYEWSDKRRYVGNWAHGVPNGLGEYKNTEGQIFSSQWVDGISIEILENEVNRRIGAIDLNKLNEFERSWYEGTDRWKRELEAICGSACASEILRRFNEANFYWKALDLSELIDARAEFIDELDQVLSDVDNSIDILIREVFSPSGFEGPWNCDDACDLSESDLERIRELVDIRVPPIIDKLHCEYRKAADELERMTIALSG